MMFTHADGGVSSAVLSAQNLHKSYAGFPALRGLSFTLQAGRILGFLGPNGAGKTTAIRILTTILDASEGEFYIDGVSSRQVTEIRRRIGVLPESLGFPKQMTGLEFLIYFCQLYGQTAVQSRATANALLAEVGMTARANSLIGSYSRGMRQRLGIARALLNDPVVVFLDEPTLGLDPRGKEELLDLVRRIARQRNAGVILCSHLLTEVEEVCDDVVILRQGKVVAMGTVTEVLQRAQHNSARVRIPEAMHALARQQLSGLSGVTAVLPTAGKPEWLTIQFSDAAAPQNSVLQTLIGIDVPVLAYEADNGRLQDVFFQLTEEATA